MTRNPITDGETVLAPLWGSMMNAHGSEAVLNGIDPSVGTGNWDVDTTAGDVFINNTTTAVGATTTTLTDPASDADLDSGEFRVDLLTADDTGTINVAEGTAAAQPITPDIPADEAVICAVVVSGDATSLQSGDIRDYRTLLEDDSGRYVDGGPHEIDAQEFAGGDGTPGEVLSTDGQNALWRSMAIYGDGSDGSITRTSNVNENGIIRATDYTVQSGVTLTVSNGVLIVLAKGTITINGTINATGQGATGGAGGNNGDNGGNGGNSALVPIGTGGAGGSGDEAGDGGDGGDGDTTAGLTRRQIFDASIPAGLAEFLATNELGGAGGGGGGGGKLSANTANTGNDGSAPGGGGSGEDNTGTGNSGPGGDGGDGGGVIILIGGEITGSGSLVADGTDGQDGTDSDTDSGGGGGGSGGAIILVTPNNSYGGNLSAAAGAGGTGGSNAGDGASGATGITQQYTY